MTPVLQKTHDALSPTSFGAADGEAALKALLALVDDDMKQVNETILARLNSPVTLIPELARYIVAAGGKRLRPVLTVACAKLCGATDMTRACALAASVEFIHTATLLHDDVVDASDLRRGNPSANAVFGNEASVLVGDFLFARAFQLMTGDGSLDVLRILSSASAVIAEGEVLQLMTAQELSTTLDAYMQVIEAKTAALFAAACEVGAVVAGADAATVTALRDYGANLGIAFQIADDVLDYSARQATLGKTVGDDFREGKMTLPVIIALENATGDERAFWQRTMAELDQHEGDLSQAQAYLAKHNALAASIDRARLYCDKARAALAPCPDGELKQSMLGVVDFIVEREF